MSRILTEKIGLCREIECIERDSDYDCTYMCVYIVLISQDSSSEYPLHNEQ